MIQAATYGGRLLCIRPGMRYRRESKYVEATMASHQIEPPNESVEEFLSREGVKISHDEFHTFNGWKGPTLPVIYMHNGLFSWAVVIPQWTERFFWGSPDDPHPPEFYLVKKSTLAPVTPGLKV